MWSLFNDFIFRLRGFRGNCGYNLFKLDYGLYGLFDDAVPPQCMYSSLVENTSLLWNAYVGEFDFVICCNQSIKAGESVSISLICLLIY
jgi:hypothetical protein